mmetsp:Transcript_34731/g.73224  ORF Transcript_34731/g.73224 Transcript_34731/m.73224 type:complete len:227 (-) Transcript_34731:120-800(-)
MSSSPKSATNLRLNAIVDQGSNWLLKSLASLTAGDAPTLSPLTVVGSLGGGGYVTVSFTSTLSPTKDCSDSKRDLRPQFWLNLKSIISRYFILLVSAFILSVLGFNRLCEARSTFSICRAPIDLGRDSNQLRDISNVINVADSFSSAPVEISHNSFRDKSRCRIVEREHALGGTTSDVREDREKLPPRCNRDKLQCSLSFSAPISSRGAISIVPWQSTFTTFLSFI